MQLDPFKLAAAGYGGRRVARIFTIQTTENIDRESFPMGDHVEQG
jgi:hypothetical protein